MSPRTTTGRATTTRRTTVVLAALLTLLVACGCSIPGTQVRDGEGIAGTYTLNGVDRDDVEYSGTVVIEATDDADRYTMQWIVTGAIHRGDARLDGDQLTVDWEGVITPRGPVSGTGSYTLDDAGNLRGSRLVDGFDGSFTETIFQKA